MCPKSLWIAFKPWQMHKRSIGVQGKISMKEYQWEFFGFRINSSINSFTVGIICVYMMLADRGLAANPLL